MGRHLHFHIVTVQRCKAPSSALLRYVGFWQCEECKKWESWALFSVKGEENHRIYLKKPYLYFKGAFSRLFKQFSCFKVMSFLGLKPQAINSMENLAQQWFIFDFFFFFKLKFLDWEIGAAGFIFWFMYTLEESVVFADFGSVKLKVWHKWWSMYFLH